MNYFSLINTIKKASKLFFNNSFFFISIMLLFITCSILFSSIQNAMLDSNSLQWLIFSITSQLFTIGLSLGFSNSIIHIIQNKDTTLVDIFEKFDLVFSYLLASIIFAIILIISMVPGLILIFSSIDIDNLLNYDYISLFQSMPETINFEAISLNNLAKLGVFITLIGFFYTYLRLQFYQYAMIYKNLNPVESIIESINITKNNLTELSMLLLLIIFINIIGAMLIVGLLFTIPISMIAIIMVYFKLTEDRTKIAKS